MFREIGGNFPLTENDIKQNATQQDIWGCSSFKNALYLNSGSSAIFYLLDNNYVGEKNVVLPAYTCITCIRPFIYRNFNIQYYTINKDLTINKDSFEKAIHHFNNNCIVYIHAYFGFNTLESIKDELADLHKHPNITIINDFTHSWLSQNQIEAHFYIASLRKWLQTPDGGILASNINLTFNNKNILDYDREQTNTYIKASLLKNRYLDNDASISKDQFLPLFNDSVACFRKKEIRAMSPISKTIYDNTNYQEVTIKRKKNCQYLIDHIKNPYIEKIFSSVPDDAVPFYLPVYVKKDRKKFQQHLAANNIYCPIHWNVPEYIANTPFANEIYPQIISLVCDQRYDLDDMERFVATVNNYK